ncbi:hypothetical protein BDN72DRAFT_689464 [Pluteus cervinus]|uniref:Uncharacterized protein n=1 Tax=Pluteus cervinus TaxID=181527 RepID=A0ACD3AQW5_9AGAR|nr:hypothetical protein BDN72DRAFT_689464 [Pluteus cervinus]
MSQSVLESEQQRVLPQPDASALYQVLAATLPSSPFFVSHDVHIMSNRIYPQTPSSIVPLLKSTLPLTGTGMPLSSTTPASSQPPSSQMRPPSQQSRRSDQPTSELLATYGVKVRDFAYESVLPPITPYNLHKRQIQPGLRPLKRQREEDVQDEDESLLFQESSQRSESSKRAKLQRELTEPTVDSQPPTRARGFEDLDEYNDDQAFIGSQQSTWDASQPPPHYFMSQDANPYIDTPTVTPNGSLQWLPEPNMPPNLPFLPHPGPSTPKAPSLLHHEYSRGFSTASSPLSEPPSSQPHVPPTKSSSSPLTYSKLDASPRPSHPPPVLSPVNAATSSATPRYQLRKRTAGAPSASVIPAPIKRTLRPRRKAASPTQATRSTPRGRGGRAAAPIRPHPPTTISRQSAHSRSKKSATPSTRTLRTRSAKSAEHPAENPPSRRK